MKLTDLITALADEVDLMQPKLDDSLNQLKQLSVDDEQYMLLLDDYNENAIRMGEAAEMVGFNGLKQVCDKVQENTLLLAIFEGDEQKNLLEFLHKWPKLVSDYLRHLDDPSIAAGLVDLIIEAPAPFTEDEALKVMHQLGVMALKASEGAVFHDPENQRPTSATLEDVNVDLADDVDIKLIESFLQESPEIAGSLVVWAQELVQTNEIVVDDIQTAKRYTHTLKGTGATIGIRALASIGHHLEDILEHLEEKPNDANDYINNVILDAAYCLQQIVDYIAGDDDEPEQSLIVLQSVLDIANRIDNGESLIDESQQPMKSSSDLTSNVSQTDVNNALDDKETKTINNIQKNDSVSEIVDNEKANKTTKPLEKQKSNKKTSALRVPLEKIDELFRISGEISIHSSAMEDKIKYVTEQASQLLDQNIRLQKRLLELETIVDVRALSVMRGSMSNQDSEKEFDPLEMDQYNELHSSTHALIEEAADARVIVHKVEDEIASLTSIQTRQKVLSRDLQHLVIGTRMSEVGTLEARLQRNVRTTCQMTGKQANLNITGQETLIDSDVINQLAEPLLHLIRNSVDHGIELPDDREVKGKQRTGNIYLDFFRQGQQVVLRCGDDGQGLNINKIKERAIEQELIAETQQLTDFEIAQLILSSGFSSRDEVSEISGRGVGLDVVREWVNNMNGSIQISTNEHGGCLFELRFSASLSTIQSLVVMVDDAYFAIPAVQIEQAVSKGVGKYDYANKKFVYYYEDSVIPARTLANMVSLPVDEDIDFSEHETVIVTVNNQRYAIAVTKLYDSRELLVKPAGRYASHLAGVAGLSILGNGAIAVNLDLSQMITATQAKVTKKSKTNTKLNVPNILIVDDALTVRKSLQQLISDIGFNAFTARDGMEAVNLLADMKPDVVLTDLEMPNMNGIELTQYIRTTNKELPVVMITSRSQAKHRELADNAGVTEYITKPYRDIELVNSIRQFLS